MAVRRNVYHEKDVAILNAASQLFLKHGYARTSMDAIAREAAVTKQTVYSYFKNKDQLFTEMVALMCQKHTPSEILLSDERKTLEELLHCLGAGFLKLITSREGLATTRLVMSEAERRPRLAHMFYDTGPKRMHAMIATVLDKKAERSGLAISDSHKAAEYFYSLLKGPYQLRMALHIKPSPSRTELEAHVTEAVRLFMRMYRS